MEYCGACGKPVETTYLVDFECEEVESLLVCSDCFELLMDREPEEKEIFETELYQAYLLQGYELVPIKQIKHPDLQLMQVNLKNKKVEVTKINQE